MLRNSCDDDKESDRRDISDILSWIEKDQPPTTFNPSTMLQHALKQPQDSNEGILQLLIFYFTTVLKEEENCEGEHSWQYTLFIHKDLLLEILNDLRIYGRLFEDRSLFMKSLLWCFRRYSSDESIVECTITCVCMLTDMFKSGEQRSEEHTLLMTEIINVLLNLIDEYDGYHVTNVRYDCFDCLGKLRRKWRATIKQCFIPFAARWCRDGSTQDERYIALEVFSACRVVPDAHQSWLYQQVVSNIPILVYPACRAIRKNRRVLFNLFKPDTLESLKRLEYISSLLLSEWDVCTQAVMLMNKIIIRWPSKRETLKTVFQNNFMTLVTSDEIMMCDRQMIKVFKTISFFAGMNGSNDVNFDDQMVKFIDKIFRYDQSEKIMDCVIDMLQEHPIQYCEKSVIRLLHLSLERVIQDPYVFCGLPFVGDALDNQFIQNICISSEQWRKDIREFIHNLLAIDIRCSEALFTISKLCRNGTVEHVLEHETLTSFILRTLEFFSKSNSPKIGYRQYYEQPILCIARMFRQFGHKLSDKDLCTIKNSDIWKSSVKLIMKCLEKMLFGSEENMFFTMILLVIEMYWFDLSDDTLNIFYKLIESHFDNELGYIYMCCCDKLELYRVHIGLLKLILATDKSMLTNEVKRGFLMNIEQLDWGKMEEDLQVYKPLYNRVLIKLQ
jgi:hypothetical protein